MVLPSTAFWPTLFSLVLGFVVLVDCKGGPTFTRKKIRTEYSATVGSSVRLRCPVSGTNDPLHNRTLVTWSHDSRYIDNTLRNYSRFRLRAGKHLKIVDVGYQDAGVYTCRAYNEFDSIEINITLKIRKNKGQNKEARGEPPKFKMNSKSHLTFKKGETAKLRCHSTGDPDPDVQWFKDDEPYDKNSKRAGVSASGWTLNLRYLSTQDTGKYMCRVSNKLGSISRTFVVKVKVRIPKPRIEEPEDTKLSVQQGKDAIFDCRVESAGKPLFTWRRWGKHLKNFNDSINLQASKKVDSKYTFHDIKTHDVDHNQFGSSLVIKNVSKSDQGRYSCFVKNKYGSDEISRYLFVIEKVFIPRTTSVIATSKQFQATESGISVTVAAVVTVSMIAIIAFVIVSIYCCRKQRKDLEKKYVINYQPDALLHAEQPIQVSQEMQKVEPVSEKSGKPEESLSRIPCVGNNATSTTNTEYAHKESLPDGFPSYCSRNNSEKTQCTIVNTDSLHELNAVVDSRTSSELSIPTASSREQFIDPKGSTNFITKCHSTCGEICRYKGQTNTSGKSDLRESVV